MLRTRGQDFSGSGGRAVLGVIASATIAFAGVAFSVSLLLISMSSSQYSPRVVHGPFRDPFNKRVMGVVIGTFTYCLVVLRAVRSPLEDGGTAVVPSLSIAVAVLLGVATLLTIVGFISHAAHSRSSPLTPPAQTRWRSSVVPVESECRMEPFPGGRRPREAADHLVTACWSQSTGGVDHVETYEIITSPPTA